MAEVEAVASVATTMVPVELRAEVEAFLYLEARLLGSGQARVWVNEMLHPDVTYRVSSRQLRSSKDTRSVGPRDVFHFDDRFANLSNRVEQVESGLQWRSDPGESLLYVVSNIEVFEADRKGDYRVYSNVVMIRDRRVYESDQFHYRREDSVRRGEDGRLRLLSRRVVYPQRFVKGKNLLFFL